jgi:hypothetical protein
VCLSHEETAWDEAGRPVRLDEGMVVTAFDLDADAYCNPSYLVATGTVARPPDWLTHAGSLWVLIIDEFGIRTESELAHLT